MACSHTDDGLDASEGVDSATLATGSSRIEAENFDKGGQDVAYHTVDNINHGGVYRPSEGVTIFSESGVSNGYKVGWVVNGWWLNYTTQIPTAGRYTFTASVAAVGGGQAIHFEVDGVNVTGTMTMPNTGTQWGVFQTATSSPVTLSAGSHVVKFVMDKQSGDNGLELDYFQLDPVADAVTTRLEAENFDKGGQGVAYNTSDNVNHGGVYRASEGVTIFAESGVSNGYKVGWVVNGWWLNYTTQVSVAGQYTLTAAIAAVGGGQRIHFNVDGVNVTGTMTMPNTGTQWGVFQTATSAPFTLSAGSHVIRFVMDGQSGDNGLELDYFDLKQVDQNGTTTGSGGNSNTTGGSTQALTFTTSYQDILNPERGFFKFVDIMTTQDLSAVRAAGSTVVFAPIRIDDWRTSALPSSFLTSLSTALGNVRNAHLKVILRFAYNYPGTDPDGSATADAPLSWITSHISQLQPIFANNVDVIVAVQAGFIGQWAEWHDSSNGLDNPSARLTVMNALLSAVPPSRFVLIRYPYEKRENWAGPITAQQAFTSSAIARIGHHNDCFLASADDMGTYHSSDDMTYLASDTVWLPMVGETCAVDAPRTNCATALSELATYHWSLLNGDFDTDVYSGWTSQGCMPSIRQQLGYRLSLQGVNVTAQAQRGGVVNISGQVVNSGYARPINARPVYLVLDNGTVRRNLLLTGVDIRQWSGQMTSSFSGSVTLDANMPTGAYKLALWMPDAASGLQSVSDYSVQFANVGVWQADTGYNVLTTTYTVK